MYYDVCTVHTAQDLTNTTGKVCVHVNPTVRTNITVQTWNTYLSADIPWSKISHTHAQASAHKYEEMILTDKYPGAQFRVELMIYLSQTSRTLSSVPQIHLWERPCCSSLHIHKKKKEAQSGTKGLDFQQTSVFLDCKSLSRVSFGLKKTRGQQWNIAKKWEERKSCWTLPLQELLSASPWRIVLPPLQVDFLQIAIAAYSQIFQRIQLRHVRVRFRAGVQWMPLNVSMWVSVAVCVFACLINTNFALALMTLAQQKRNSYHCRPEMILTPV